MTVKELAECYAGLARNRNEDWIWESMIKYPDIVGGFNRLDTTVMKSCEGQVIAKEGADGLLGLGIVHKISGWLRHRNQNCAWLESAGDMVHSAWDSWRTRISTSQSVSSTPAKSIPRSRSRSEKLSGRLRKIPTWA